MVCAAEIMCLSPSGRPRSGAKLTAMTVTAGKPSDQHGVDGGAAEAERVSAELVEAQLQITHLRAALATNRTIAMAIGRLVERWSLPQEVAFAVLQRYSQDSNRKLRDIAADLMATGQLPTNN